MSPRIGKWHKKNPYFGLHYDLHAGATDADLGTRTGLEDLVPMLKLMGVDFVQTDCKGHPGYTSWFSKVANASVSAGVKKDAMEGWRNATRKIGVPLHCHYSGIWDAAAGKMHPEWGIVAPDGKPQGAPFGQNSGAATVETMCPRSPYVDELLIPQFLELIDRYGVDGFWVDGDMWAVKTCYCHRCKQAFKDETGIENPPTEKTDPNWVKWIVFTRAGFEQYVTKYCNAVHKHKPGVLVCSNWLQTFKNPGDPSKVPTDWISGDVPWVFNLDGSRIESRFLSTREKHWDLMIWAFYCSHDMGKPDSPWTFKPVQMIQQEAAIVAALGGGVQIYENPSPLRTGQLVPWHMKRLGQVGKFVKARRKLCQDSETIPQVAVLHSEVHLYTQPVKSLMWDFDLAAVQGATFGLIDNHYGTDLLDEWAMLRRIKEFPVVVSPEQDHLSDAMVTAMKEYVAGGGKLLVSGSHAFDRFGGEFLGVESLEVKEKATYFVPAGDGTTSTHSDHWRLVKPTTAKLFGRLGKSALLDDRLTDFPAATINKIGRGAVAYVPFNLFRFFDRNRYPQTCAFIGEVTRALAGRMDFEFAAPASVDITLRKLGGKTIIHLINRSSGLPNKPGDGAVDEIPFVGPVKMEIKIPKKPKRISLAWEKSPIKWKYAKGKLTASVDSVHIHSALVIEP